MQSESPISFKLLMLCFFISICAVVTIYLLYSNDTSSKIVFCDVGKGSAVYLRIDNRYDVLINTGPDKKVLNCLGKHMPFFDRKIETVLLTNQTANNTKGFSYIIERYNIDSLLSTASLSSRILVPKVKTVLSKKNIKPVRLEDETLQIGTAELTTRYISNDYYILFIIHDRAKIALSGHLAARALAKLIKSNIVRQDINNSAIIQIHNFGSNKGLIQYFNTLANNSKYVLSDISRSPFQRAEFSFLELLKAQSRLFYVSQSNGGVVFAF